MTALWSTGALYQQQKTKQNSAVIGSLLYPAADGQHFAHNMPGVFPKFPNRQLSHITILYIIIYN